MRQSGRKSEIEERGQRREREEYVQDAPFISSFSSMPQHSINNG